MTQSVSFCVPGNLGATAGAGGDGVLLGQLVPTNPTAVILKGHAADPLCITDDGGLYVDLSTEVAEDTADDVAALPATPADDDAIYFGLADGTFSELHINVTTAGAGTWTLTWQYWDGNSWEDIPEPTDGTLGFSSGTAGWKVLSFTPPVDWAPNTVDSVLAYWVRGVVSEYSAITTRPLIGQAYANAIAATYTDDTTDFTDADAGDVALLPAFPVVGDGLYIGYSAKFFKIKVTTSQAGTGTYTVTVKYWNGTAWAAITTILDGTASWKTAAGTLYIGFVPPADWAACTAANGPDGTAGYFVFMELTAKTSVTQAPLATRGWVLPVNAGAGVPAPNSGSISKVCMNALTVSGTNADTVLLIMNLTRATFAAATWTKADAFVIATTALATVGGDALAVAQITKDGSTEFANANIILSGW